MTLIIHSTLLRMGRPREALVISGLLLLLFFTRNTLANGIPIINLAQWEQTSLLESSDYIADKLGQMHFAQIKQSSQWQPLGRSQLRFGQIDGNIWLKMRFSTSNGETQSAILAFHRIIDFVNVEVFANQQRIQQYKRGAFLTKPIGEISTNKNLMRLTLKANTNYTIYAQLYGKNSVVGAVELWNTNAFRDYDQFTLSFFIAYAVAVLVIALYNIGAYYSTQYHAFLYHSLYAISLVLLQASQYGYLDPFLKSDHMHRKDLLIIFSACVTYSSILAFLDALLENKVYRSNFNLITKIFIVLNGLIALIAIINYQIAIILLVLSVILGIIFNLILAIQLFSRKDAKRFILLSVLIIFAPSGIILILSRLGIIDQNFLTDNLLLIIIIFEMILISTILFSQIRKIRLLFWRSKYLDPNNNIPNIVSLREALDTLQQRKVHYTLSYIWLSGIERMEIVQGTYFHHQYLKELATLISKILLNSQFTYPLLHDTNKQQNIFYCDKNTLGLITIPLNNNHQQQLKNKLLHALEEIKKRYTYNIDIKPIIASCNSMQYNAETIINNINITLAQCIRGNNQSLFYSTIVGYNEKKQIALLDDFEQALNKHQFKLYWQPQISTQSNTLAGIEAQVYWQHPIYNRIPPNYLIPLLEQNVKTIPLSLWLLKQVLRETVDFIKKYPHISISVNLSIHDLLSTEFITDLESLAKSTPTYIIEHIILEVTESILMENTNAITNAIKMLQQQGFRLSIDNFGAGHASFGYLQTLPANELKIDQRYTKTCHKRNSQAIIQTIIYLAKRLNMQVVAVGIENQQQKKYFVTHGVHRLQGKYLNLPLTKEDLLQQYPA